MNWKTNIQLRDLEGGQRLELTCHHCGIVSFKPVTELKTVKALDYAYLDEVEAFLRCTQRGCHGTVRLAVEVDAETEGFSGGLA